MCYEDAHKDGKENAAGELKALAAETFHRPSSPSSALDASILSLHNEGCSESEISEALGLEETAVKYSLLRSSVDYRKENNKIRKEHISDDDLSEFFESYKDLARNTEDEYLKEKTLRWLISEKKGYNDTKKNILPLNGGINLFVLNNSLKELKSRGTQGQLPTIDVESA